MANRRSSLAPSSISTSRQSSLAYKGCSEPMNDAALQFKLSKKVAELTLVVHMLFTRNHEREVELEATKEAYEQEINSVSNFFEKEIMRLKSELEKEKWKRQEEMERLSKVGDESTRKLLERHDKNVSELTAENEKLKSNHMSLEEKYNRVVEDHERAKRDHDALTKERAAKDRAMEKDHLRIEKLQQNARANKELMEKMKENIHNIQKSVNHKISQMDTNNRSANEVSENLRVQNEQLEAENKTLRKKIADQTSQLKRLESSPLLPPCPTSIKPKTPKSIDSDLSKDEEIERLKREVQKYRLELGNREENFNKIFSEMNPVMVRNGGMSCVKELRDGRAETARSNEIPIYSYKQKGHTRRTMRLRSKNVSSRSLLPSLSSPGRPYSTRGEPGKYSLLSEGPANHSRLSPDIDKTQPISAAANASEQVLETTENVQPGFVQAENNVSDYNWIFGKTPSMSVEDKLNRGIR